MWRGIGVAAMLSGDLSDVDLEHGDNGDNHRADKPDNGAEHADLQDEKKKTTRKTKSRGIPSFPQSQQIRPLLNFPKRPRRNVVKRSIEDFLGSVEDENRDKQKLLGLNVIYFRGRRRFRTVRTLPRFALGLFLLAVLAGMKEIISDVRKSAVDDGETKVPQDDEVDLSRPSQPSSNETDLIQEYDDSSSAAVSSVADTPVLLFGNHVSVPKKLSNFVTVKSEGFNPLRHKLFIWSTPRTGSTTIKEIASQCLGLTLASEAGKGYNAGSDDDNKMLRIVEGLDGSMFANVDLTNPRGIAMAKSKHIARDERIDLISSAYLFDSADLFTPESRGYMIAIFRHPIQRAVSLYYSLKRNPLFATQMAPLQTIDQYARSNMVENNWLTRFLTATYSGKLGPEHEAVAKEVLRTKCLVGLLKEKTETMRRFSYLFDNLMIERSQRSAECTEKLLYWDWPGKNRHELVLEGDPAYERLYEQNMFDIRLYEYAETLFSAQSSIFTGLE